MLTAAIIALGLIAAAIMVASARMNRTASELDKVFPQ